MKKLTLSIACACVPAIGLCSEIGGIEFPAGALSFADQVVSYTAGTDVSSPYTNYNNALGVPDYVSGGDPEYVSLGNTGEIVLQFTNNALTTSGDDSNDLWVFEIGEKIEPVDVYISEDGENWIFVGSTDGGIGGVDIDAYVGLGVVQGTSYTYVKLIDLLPAQSGSPWAGADIDAVGAISSTDGICGTQEELTPATYDKTTGKLNIPNVVADGKCYTLELDGTSGIEIDLNEVYTTSSIEER